MLRITVHDSASELRLHLEGRLAGPWVREVALCWETAQSIAGSRTVLVDLCAVDFVDGEGEQLLVSMHRKGVMLRAAGPMMTYLIEEIAAAEESDSASKEGPPWSVMIP